MTGSRTLIPLRSQGTAPALFIVAAAGATPYTLIRLARALPVQAPIYSFFAAGFDEDTSPLMSVAETACEYVREIGAVQARGPYRLAGHCAGGLVALEMAAGVEARGEKVEVVILMDSLAPPTAGSSLISAAGVDPTGDEALNLNLAYERILKSALDKLGKVPGALAAQYGRNCLLEFSAAVRYQARRISAPIYLLRTEHLPESLYKGWVNLTDGQFVQHVVPGDSNSMLAPPHVTTLSRRISEIIADAESSSDFSAVDTAASP